MIKEYIAKPIKVQAIQFKDDRYTKIDGIVIKHCSEERGFKENIDEILKFTNSNNYYPKIGFINGHGDLCIRTTNGNIVFPKPNDYIIKETYNTHVEFSVCNSKTFKSKYEEML